MTSYGDHSIEQLHIDLQVAFLKTM
ncbi:hypothetical protein PROAA_290012 [Candidatus Propionivibrio aalborgensis]|uniref:Uncharacterized protein n=1 Tax=Candidatus Propionivibrio aalborgensis TaxID=1860101 RepID=A0A1A8XVR4_9RHOO|nr:hypothetical protein PROAA_290012 [Candidatus Propionivibrio aalborgensis]